MSYSHHLNKQRLTPSSRTDAAECARNLSKWTDAVNEIQSWPEYEPQPLRDLKGFAEQMGVSNLYLKDESLRFGPSLGSFKALGAPYAVYKLLAGAVHTQKNIYPSSEELRSGKYCEITQRMTVCVATDGNQGRGLAYGAKIFHCQCVVYIHNHVSSGRAEAMKDLGATVIRINGEYEASVERAREDAGMNDWHFVSSTSWSDFDNRIPQNVMNAYMVLVEETLNMLPAVEKISHVFVCGGVGSIAAAVFFGFLTRHQQIQKSENDSSSLPPRFIVVEPDEADCLLQSASKGGQHPSEGNLRTIMAGLACRNPSPAALKLLLWLASDFVTVPDIMAVDGMKVLASNKSGDVPVVCGESSAASMGFLLAGSKDHVIREELGIDSDSQIVLFVLEGATDPNIYEEIVGMRPETVFKAQADFLRHTKL